MLLWLEKDVLDVVGGGIMIGSKYGRLLLCCRRLKEGRAGTRSPETKLRPEKKRSWVWLEAKVSFTANIPDLQGLVC